MKNVYMAILGLAAAAVVTGSFSSRSAREPATAQPATVQSDTGQSDTGQPPGASLGPGCQALTLVDSAAVSQFTRPSVCVVRDTAGKRFYLFSGVLRFVAGQPVQAEFTVSPGLALNGATIVPVAGFQGGNPADTYYGYGLIEPDGQIKIEGTRNGQSYTVSVSGQIPVGIRSG